MQTTDLTTGTYTANATAANRRHELQEITRKVEYAATTKCFNAACDVLAAQRDARIERAEREIEQAKRDYNRAVESLASTI